jgi:hypothetical protein
MGHEGVESLLDLLGDLRSLPKALLKSIPDNYRAMLAQLETEFGAEISNEYVYDQCPDCTEIYRGKFAAASVNLCPTCAAPRYVETADGKHEPRGQVMCPTAQPCVQTHDSLQMIPANASAGSKATP